MASAAGYAGYDSAAISSGAQGMASWCNAGEFSDKLPLALPETRLDRRGRGITMQQIADWLEKLGLSEYTVRFAQNGIDISVLRYLTDQDLKDIGVLLGHRRKMLAAISELTGASPITSEAAAVEAQPKTQDSAERRQVTVMFSDLVGSTALSARMDPEDLRELMSAYQKCAAEAVRRFGGFVARYMGDGVLVSFGYPEAHEHDAERAVRAGLELIAAVIALKTPTSLQTRVGIATGLVVVGDLIGSDEAQERGIVGETPNLAARLQELSQPNSVVIAESTRKLIGDLFECNDLGPVLLKGLSNPVPAWWVRRESPIENRFTALRSATLSPLIGRDEEVELVLRRWARAREGEGQIVLAAGEAGIGKSRIAAEIQERLEPDQPVKLHHFCSPHHRDNALYPFIARIERAAGFDRDEAAASKLDKLAALLSRSENAMPETVAVFADVLGLPSDGRYTPPTD